MHILRPTFSELAKLCFGRPYTLLSRCLHHYPTLSLDHSATSFPLSTQRIGPVEAVCDCFNFGRILAILASTGCLVQHIICQSLDFALLETSQVESHNALPKWLSKKIFYASQQSRGFILPPAPQSPRHSHWPLHICYTSRSKAVFLTGLRSIQQ